ncbi:MAG: recombination mediator RecR [Bacilli bacterium]|nr:recombination mediator RecR [Bacilli bacterium]MDD4406596.1 recombination mediator RecR [Bacilli bacterium]
MIYPKPLEELILYFKKLPGVGEKSAERLALSVVNFTNEDNERFSNAIKRVNKNLQKCNICANLTDNETCNICSNEYRDQNLICVVEDYKSIFMFEKIGKFNGVYHVLNGLISPIDGINPEDINLNSLILRCEKKAEAIELILALKPSIEGETTSMYINKKLKKQNIKISRLSYGIPMGAEIDYLDTLTIERALKDRQIIS